MRSCTRPWGGFFLVLGLGAALLVLAGLYRMRGRAEMDWSARRATDAYVFAVEAAVPPLEPEIVDACPVCDDDGVEMETKKIFYPKRRRRGPLRDSDEWFPYVALALGACGLIGFVRLRVGRARV